MAIAQDKLTLQCDLCKNHNDVKWKCLECKEWLCFNCKTAHSNSKASKDHNVSSLIDADLAEQLQIQNKLCNVHKTESLCMYCKDCQKPLCLKCITSSDHKSHDFENLSDIVNRQVEDLVKFLDRVKKCELEGLKKSVQDIQRKQDLYDEEKQACINNVRRQGGQLKEAVDKIVETSIESLEQRSREDKSSSTKMKDVYVKQIADLRGKIQSFEKKIQSSNKIEIMNMSTEIKTSIQQHLDSITIKQSIHVKCPTFIHQTPDNKASDMLKQLLGYFDFEAEVRHVRRSSEHVVMATIPDKQSEMRIISRCQYGKESFYVSCCSPEVAWIGSGSKLTKINKDGTVMKSLKCGKYNITGLAKTKSGQLLFSTNDFSIDTLDSTETGTKTFCRTNSNYIGGICVAQDGDIYQCQFTRVVKMSPDGKEKQIIDFKDGKYADIRSAMFITENVNGDLWISSGDGRVCVVLSKDGKYKLCYSGPKGYMGLSKFCDVTHNKHGEVLICDYRGNNIHRVDKDGNFIQYLNTEDHGILKPAYISHDNHQRVVWISCGYGHIIVARY